MSENKPIFFHICRAIEYTFVNSPILNKFYWKWAPKYYQRRLQPDVIDVDLPIKPFQIHWVSPDQINRFSGISGRPSNRLNDIGSIKDGSWDEPEAKPRHLTNSPLTETMLTDTILFKSMQNHFVNNVPWEETEIITNANKESDWYWHGYKNKQGFLKKSQEVDQLYKNIHKKGYKTQLEIVKKNYPLISIEKAGFLNMLLNEIVVDLGRDGSILLVDGRHRVSIAKILNLNEIPVLVLTRHKKWINKLQEGNLEGVSSTNPDLKYL